MAFVDMHGQIYALDLRQQRRDTSTELSDTIPLNVDLNVFLQNKPEYIVCENLKSMDSGKLQASIYYYS